jgi:hypothetical protein
MHFLARSETEDEAEDQTELAAEDGAGNVSQNDPDGRAAEPMAEPAEVIRRDSAKPKGKRGKRKSTPIQVSWNNTNASMQCARPQILR